MELRRSGHANERFQSRVSNLESFLVSPDPIRVLFPLCVTIVGAAGLIVVPFFWSRVEVWTVMVAGFLITVGLWSTWLEIKRYEKF